MLLTDVRISLRFPRTFIVREKKEELEEVRLVILRCVLLTLRVDFNSWVLHQFIRNNTAEQYQVAVLQLCAPKHGLDNARNIGVFDMGWHSDSCWQVLECHVRKVRTKEWRYLTQDEWRRRRVWQVCLVQKEG